MTNITNDTMMVCVFSLKPDFVFCRHTYCNNMAKSGMNPKTFRYLMGHLNIGVTTKYIHASGAEDAREELGKCAKMAKILSILIQLKDNLSGKSL